MNTLRTERPEGRWNLIDRQQAAIAVLAAAAVGGILVKGCAPAEYEPQCNPGMKYTTDGTESGSDIIGIAEQNTPNMDMHPQVFQKELEYFNPGIQMNVDLPQNTVVIIPDCPTAPTK